MSLYLGGGAMINYTRGFLGGGGFPGTHYSKYGFFHAFYAGGKVELGFRIKSKKRKIVYEIAPYHIYVGPGGYTLGFLSFGITLSLLRKLIKTKNVSFVEIFTLLNSLIHRHLRISKNKNFIQNNSFYAICQFSEWTQHFINRFLYKFNWNCFRKIEELDT